MVPTLGGDNGDVSTITNAGLVLGFAETTLHDPTCIAPQVLGFDAFLWNPETNDTRLLPPLPGDTVTAAFDINEQNEVVGASGICGGGLVPTSALHAVMWKNGAPLNLGSLGGAYGNVANFINDLRQVVGTSDIAGDADFHGFLWTEAQGIHDLGTLPGDTFSSASAINNEGLVLMQSCDANFNCRAALWQRGVMTDMNTLVAGASPLFLLSANWINSQGQIVGAAFDQNTGAVEPFLATPCACNTSGGGNQGSSLPDAVRQQMRERLLHGSLRNR